MEGETRLIPPRWGGGFLLRRIPRIFHPSDEDLSPGTPVSSGAIFIPSLWEVKGDLTGQAGKEPGLSTQIVHAIALMGAVARESLAGGLLSVRATRGAYFVLPGSMALSRSNMPGFATGICAMAAGVAAEGLGIEAVCAGEEPAGFVAGEEPAFWSF
jgi:hypothetical protein